jgi:ABC-2 type transport system ATP-binding protein
MSNAIVIKGVRKAFGRKVAVDDLDLTIPEGSLYGFIGPNGAGKTTTIRMIMSILFPDRGEISVLGKSSAVESKDRIGYLPEERGLYRKMKVGPFLEYMAHLKGVDSAGLRPKIREWLARVELADTYKKKCEELSKGMQQKVQFIAAVIHEPDLIILDEPFSGLDPVNRRLLRELLDEQHEAGRTVIFSTHAMFEAEQLCDSLFMIHEGRKVLDAPMEEIWRRYDPKVVYLEPVAPLHTLDTGTWADWPGVLAVLQVGAGIEIKLRPEADPAAIMARVAQTIPVRRVELKRPSLEDIFIEIVGVVPGVGDAAAGPVPQEAAS